ncbi:hypothetical protein BC332_29588 [Capsicum chinense]|nr:hypothetical protein BC332_29588 [Capsicum chinense]
MPPHRIVNQNAQTDEVRPTYGMRTRNRAYTPEFVPTPGVPLVPTSPPRAPWTNANRPPTAQGDISNVEFRRSIHMLTQLVANQAQRSEGVGSASVTSEATRVGHFMKMNPPKFTGTKVEEDPQEFVDEIEKIFKVMHVDEVEASFLEGLRPFRPRKFEAITEYLNASCAQRFRAKCALTYPTRYFSPLEDEADLAGNSLDHHSTDSYLSSSTNSSSKDKVLAESVDSVDDEPLFPEPDRDLSDCETSLSTRRSCRELIHNVSGVLSKIDQLKGSKLSYAKQVILNAELIFGTTPQQQALPVEDGFSVSHFLLNEHEMFSSFLWMAFGEFLGCNDTKQMHQLKGFAFDCLLEYLDSKFSPISDSGFRTCTKLPSSMTKEILIADIIDEVEEWTQFVGLIPDKLIEWGMSHSLGKCTDFEIEEYECGTEFARHILQELVDEVVLDLYSSS